MTLSTKAVVNGVSLKVSDIGGRQKTNNMKKYQQLALTIVSMISLMAFLFYKHEYDRLRYTLEYLEMFGSAPDEDGFVATQSCGFNIYRRLRTIPSSWIKISNDLVVYSAFWDEGISLRKPVVRTLAVVRKTSQQPLELKALISYEGSSTIMNSQCTLEKIKERNHAELTSSDLNGLTLAYVVCRPEYGNRDTPLALQFQIGRHPASPPIQIQESESWKSVMNVTAVCAFASSSYVTTQQLIEFIAFYNLIGVEKFTFFGPVLTPLTRKMLDKYGDESGIFYEEHTFNIPTEFTLNDDQMRTLIEKDCIFRHRDTHENLIILKINQFILPQTMNSIQGILKSVQGTETVSEFHFQTQRICIDSVHTKVSDLYLDSQVRMVSDRKEDGIALMRPHLSTGGIMATEQHIPASVAIVLHFETCDAENQLHSDDDHLPSSVRFAEEIRRSLLYRKWKINF